MALTAEQYLAHLQALLPQGAAWPRDASAAQTKMLQSLADELGRLDDRADALVLEADPRRTSELLLDWERMLALPDDCTASLSLSTAERQRLVLAKLTELGGQSRAYFIALAASYGVPGCTITEFGQMTCNSDCNDALCSQADEYVWRVNVPLVVDDARLMNCNDDCNDALQMYTPNLIECPLQERKPAHTNVIFSYIS